MEVNWHKVYEKYIDEKEIHQANQKDNCSSKRQLDDIMLICKRISLKQLTAHTNYSAKLQIELYLIDIEHQKNYIESDVISFVTLKIKVTDQHKAISGKLENSRL